MSSPAANASTKLRSSSPQRVLSKSVSSAKQNRSRAGDIKLTDLMDEDEVRWMSNAESSRSPTPSQIINTRPIQQKQPRQEYKIGYRPIGPQHGHAHKSGSIVRIETPPPVAEPLGYSRNMTPPLPPLPNGRGSPVSKTHVRALSEPMSGLTALPQRAFPAISSTFAQRVFKAAKADLLYDYVERGRWPFHTCKHGALDIGTLARMQQHVLQQKLVEQVRAIGERGAWMEIGISDTIREYCQVNRDLEYMQSHMEKGGHSDPFLITTARTMEARLLEDAGMARRNELFDHLDKDRKHPRIPRPLRHSSLSQALWRLAIMLLMALALLVPYLVALLAPTQLARVITICACILLFALAITLTKWDLRSTRWPMALTLVYAAALVIFVGVNPARYGSLMA